ncbi:MAG TPA: M23 family metallopeptidase [Longilinea sp.]|nr:M23 family metallopeptidase [Longilinea sp.]
MARHFGLGLAVGFLLMNAACSQAATPAARTVTSLPTLFNTATILPTVAATASQAPSLTATPASVPFNPSDCSIEACILAGDYWLDRPIAAPALQMAENSYLFGSTQNGQRITHSGVEFYNATGTEVLAAADGRVTFAGDDSIQPFAPWTHFYGNLIILEHASPRNGVIYTLYAHLSEIDVQIGQDLKAGQVIGKVGMSGAAIGSHLHFEMRDGSLDFTAMRNPFLFLKPLTDSNGNPLAVLAGQLMDSNGQYISSPQLVAEQIELPDNSPPRRYYMETYATDASSDPEWQENFVLGDLQPGRYRISFVFDGKLIERFITLSAGKLTYLSLQMEN